MAAPFYPQALGLRRCRDDLPSYEGPLGEHNGEFEAFPCEKCGSLTGLGLSADDKDRRAQILLCHDCIVVRKVERVLKGPKHHDEHGDRVCAR